MASVLDYKYRTDKLFDFSQIDSQCQIPSGVTFRRDKKRSPPPVFLTQAVLRQLESFSIEEKLNLSAVTYNPSDFQKVILTRRKRSDSIRKSE